MCALAAAVGCSDANPGALMPVDFAGAATDGGNPFRPPPPILGSHDDAAVDDQGIVTDGGAAACQKNATGPLSWYVLQNVSAQQSGPLGVVVPDGVQISGTVSIPSLPTGASFLGGLIQGGDPATQTRFKTSTVTPTPDGKGFTYSLVVPPATYVMQNRFTVLMPGGAHANRYSEDSATVCDVTVHNMLLPAFPPLTMAAVTVKDLRLLDAPVDPTQPVTATLFFENSDHTFITSALATINTSTGIGSLTAPVTSEMLHPSVQLDDPDKTTSPQQGGYDTVVSLPTVNAAASYDLTIPALVKLTGNLTSTVGLAQAANPAGLLCVGPRTGNFVDESTFSNVMADTPSYKTYYRKDAQCSLQAAFIVAMAGAGTTSVNEIGFLYMPLATPEPVTLSANRVTNLTPPPLGAKIALSGTLSDARGAALVGRTINATSTTLTNIPNGMLNASVVSDGSGKFTLNLLPGTYELEITTYTN
jgi:hypothetical protein